MAFLSCTLRTNGTPRTAQLLQVPGVGRAGPLAATIWSFVADAVLAASGEEWTIPAGTQALLDDGTTALDLSTSAYLIYALLGEPVLHALRQELVVALVDHTDICPLAWVDAHHDLAPLGLLGAVRGIRTPPFLEQLTQDWIFLADRADYVPMDDPAGGPQIENPSRDAYSVQHLLQPYPQVDAPGSYTQGPYHPGLSANRIACRMGYLLMIDHAGGLLTRPVNDPTRTRRPLLPLLYSDAAAPLPHALGVAADADAWWLLAEYPGGGGKTRGLHILRSNADFPYDSAHWQLRRTLLMPAPITAGGLGSDVIATQAASDITLEPAFIFLTPDAAPTTCFRAWSVATDAGGGAAGLRLLDWGTVVYSDGYAQRIGPQVWAFPGTETGGAAPGGVYWLVADPATRTVTFVPEGATIATDATILLTLTYTLPAPPALALTTARLAWAPDAGPVAYGIGGGGACLVGQWHGTPGLWWAPAFANEDPDVVQGFQQNNLLTSGISPYYDDRSVLVGFWLNSARRAGPQYTSSGGGLVEPGSGDPGHTGGVILEDGTQCCWGETVIPFGAVDPTTDTCGLYYLPGVGFQTLSLGTTAPPHAVLIASISATPAAWALATVGTICAHPGDSGLFTQHTTTDFATGLADVPSLANPSVLPVNDPAGLRLPNWTATGGFPTPPIIGTSYLNADHGGAAMPSGFGDPLCWALLVIGTNTQSYATVNGLQANIMQDSPLNTQSFWRLSTNRTVPDNFSVTSPDDPYPYQLDVVWTRVPSTTTLLPRDAAYHNLVAVPGYLAWSYVTDDDPYTGWSGAVVPLPPVWTDVLRQAAPPPSAGQGVSYAAVRFGGGSPAPVYVSTTFADDGRGIDQFGIPLYVPGGTFDLTPWTPPPPDYVGPPTEQPWPTPGANDLLRLWAVCTDGPGGQGIYSIDTSGTSFFRGAGHGTSYSQITPDLVPPAPDYIYYWAHIAHHGEVVVHGDGDQLWGRYALNSTITRLFGPDAFPTARTVPDGSAVTALTRLLGTAGPAALEWTGPVCTPDGLVCLIRTTLNVASVPAGQSVSFIAYTDRDVTDTVWYIDLVDETDHLHAQFGRLGPGGCGFPISYATPGTHDLRAVLSSENGVISADAVWSDPLTVDWT